MPLIYDVLMLKSKLRIWGTDVTTTFNPIEYDNQPISCPTEYAATPIRILSPCVLSWPLNRVRFYLLKNLGSEKKLLYSLYDSVYSRIHNVEHLNERVSEV